MDGMAWVSAPLRREGRSDKTARSGSGDHRGHGGRLAAATAITGILLIAAIWATIAAYIVGERNAAIHHAEVEATNLSAAFQEEISQTLRSVTGAMAIVAQRMRATQGRYDIHAWARDIPLLSAATIQGSVLTPDGTLISNTLVGHPEPINLSDREYVRIQLDGRFKGIFVSKPVIGRLSGKLSLKVTQRVEAADGTFLGVIVFSVAPEQLTTLHERIDFGAGGRLSLIGATDRIIRAQFGPGASADAAGKQIPPVAMPTDSDHPTINVDEGVIDHAVRLYSKRRIPGYDLIVSVGMGLDDVLATPRAHARQIIIVGAAVTTLLCALLVLLVTEIRQRGRREIELRASERRLRDFAELSSDWFWEQDAELRFTNIGPGTPLLDQDDTSHHGHLRWELNDTSSAPELWEEHRRVCMNHEPFRDFRYTRLTPEGRTAHVSISGIPLYDEAGVFIGYRGTGRDVTAEVEAENELRSAKARAEQAESLLRDAVDSISEGFVIYDHEDRFVLCNEAYRRLYPESVERMLVGITFEQIVRHGLACGDYPDAIGHEAEFLAERMRWHRAAAGELEQRLSSDRWALISERRMRNGGIAGLRVDITKLKQAQIALRDSERRIGDFAETTSDWFWEQDAEFRFTWISEAAPMLADGDDHTGKRRSDFVAHHRVPDGTWSEHQKILDAHQPFRDFRYAIIAPDGSQHYVSTSGNPVFDVDGRFQGYRGTGRDITREMEAEAELRAAKERAEQAEELLRDAVDSMSEGFVIFDHDDRFVLCNEAYRRSYPASAHLMVSGVLFEELVRKNLAAGHYPAAAGHEEEWFADFMRQHQAANSEFEQQLSDGRWILVSQRRMRNGGIAGLRINITALKQAQLALRDSEARLDSAQQIAGIGSWELDIATGRYLWSREMYRLRGLSPSTTPPVRGELRNYLNEEDRPHTLQWLSDLEAGIRRDPIEYRVKRPDGERIVNVEGRPVFDEQGRILKVVGTMQDITERRLTEQKLIQAQKMETIGQLTGGMAHDFNNVLGVVIGNLDLLGRLTKNDPLAEELRVEAHQSAMRGADLTRRLLAFARRQPLQPLNTEVNGLVDGLAKLLKRILGENVVLGLDLDPQLWPVVVDPTQLEAALANLAANARDAMPRGGRLDISTHNACLDLAYAEQYPEVNPGNYVLIEVSDTGTGIPREVIGRIFEPFFTTKETGKGSGLGLSMVFGFIRQSGGHVAVYSEPGLGSTFRVYLPRSSRDATDQRSRSDDTAVQSGHESVLVVEDNAPLRRATVLALRAFGYRVLEAEDADSALDILQSQDCIDLLFSDIVMPGEMNGMELASRATALRPTLRVLLTSGFPDMRGAGQKITAADYRLLTKPYRHDELARALREVLDAHDAVLADG